MKARIGLFLFALVMGLVGLVVRLFFIQILPNSALEQLKNRQYLTVVQIPAQRGKILDRKGEELATSVTSQSLYTDTSRVVAPKRLSRKLASLLQISPKILYSTLTSGKKFAWIKRQLDQRAYGEIKSWGETGLYFVEEGKRAYPNQSLASSLLGLVGTDGNGLEGLEKKYDSELKGEKQSVLSKRDARGRPLVVSGQLFEYQRDGATIQTTLDKDLQYELEQELEKVAMDQMADHAMGIVMDPMTGEILAMGSSRGTGDLHRNRAITDIYEPGSTFKVVTVAAALRSGKIQPNTKFFCENGKFKIGKHTIHEAETSHGFGWLTLAEILEVSSNIGTTKVAFELGQDAFQDMIGRFGFGFKTGIDFPGEARGIVNPDRWPDHLLSNISFGHGIGVTAMQMVNAYSTIANGGKLMRPYLVKNIIDTDGKILEEKKPQVLRQVLTSKESSLITMMLSGVTEQGGTGTLARVDGYPVAGKTGTAQKVDPNGKGYLSKSYVSSFLGFVPANNPQFTIYIVVDNPRKQFYGAQVAAPIFNHIASFALHQRGFMPIIISDAKAGVPSDVSLLETPLWVSQNAKKPDLTRVPNLTGLTVKEVSKMISESGMNPEVDLQGSGISRSQWPPAGSVWQKKMRVVFRSEE